MVADEREREATDDHFASGLRIEVEAGFFQLGKDEPIEGLVDFGDVGCGDGGRSRGDDRLEGPVLPRVVGVGLGFLRPGQTLTHPLRERRDRLGRKLLVFAWHGIDVRRFDVIDRLDQAAGFGFARDHHRTDLASLEDELTRIQAQSGLLFLFAVALVTMVSQDRADFLFEELQLRGRGGLGGGRRDGEQKGGKVVP